MDWNLFKKLLNFFKPEPQSYQGTTARKLKGNAAPKGMIYCIVRYKKYVAWQLVRMKGLTENAKADIFASLFQRIKRQYKV